MMLKETEDLILKYFSAFENLYGIIPVKRAFNIIKKQNPQLNITKEEFADFIENNDFSKEYYYIISEGEVYEDDVPPCDIMDKIIVADYILSLGDPQDYEDLSEEQKGRLFYVPEKAELLKYSEEHFIEKDKHYYALAEFLNKILKISHGEEIAWDMALSLRIDDDEPDKVINNLRFMSGYKFKDFKNKQEATDFAVIYTNLRNHSRMHKYKGYTPSEIGESYYVDCVLENK